MKKFLLVFFFVFAILDVYSSPLFAMEIVFGKKYPIAQSANLDQLAWQFVQFEKDVTGKVIYKLQATHPNGVKLSYLKGKDYLLSEDIQKNMVRNFEVRQPEVSFEIDNTVMFEVVLPYDFQTRYLPLRFETKDGYQELVLRLRFGDYRFMLASRVLNNVSFVEAGPVLAAKQIEFLFMKRGQLKKRAPKEVAAEQVSNVQVDDIYNTLKEDLKIQSKIVTNVDEVLASESSEEVMDEFDALVNKYLPSPDDNKPETGSESLVLGRSEKESLDNSTDDLSSDKNYQQYLDAMGNEKIESQTFDTDASIEEIIAQSVNASRTDSFGANLNSGSDTLPDETVDESSPDESSNEDDQDTDQLSSKSKRKLYTPVDAEAIFGFTSENWSEPKSAPVLVIKPKPADKKRDLASFAAPKRNNFVEMVPSKLAPRIAPGSNMDDLFGGESNSDSGFGGPNLQSE